MAKPDEQHISLPVSLIEGLLDDFGTRRLQAKRDAQARLDSLNIDPEDGEFTCGVVIVHEGRQWSCERIAGHPGPHAVEWGGWPL